MAASQDETRFRAVVDTAVDGVILIDEKGTIRMFNPACQRLFGYSAAEVEGQNVKMLMPEPYRDEHDRYISNYHRTGERKIIGIGREVVGRRKDGTTFPMDLSVGEAKEDGRPIFVGIIHDLTERKRIDQAAIETTMRMKAVLDTAVDGIILIDAKGSILMFNPACERLFGYAADEVMGQNVKVLMPQPYRAEHDQYLEHYLTTGERKIIGIGREVVGQRKDGTTFPIDLSVGQAEQQGQSVFVGIIHDLTERKHTEEKLVQAQKMETVGQLSGGIAHDFNNLLTIIIGNSETLSEKLRARPDLKQLADMALAAGERGAELTQRLLAFSRRQVLQPVAVDCRDLIDQMLGLLQRTLHDDITIQVSHAEGLPPALADPSQLESAILNLALNAQDAMSGGGLLTISTADAVLDERYRDSHPEVLPGEYVMVSVTDNGVGMSADILDRVFEPFFTTKEVGKGSGLGLSMVYGFVKQSNGHVAIYSEPRLGTAVRLYLPTARQDGQKSKKAFGDDERVAAPGGTETVLVVEDDSFVRGYAVACLESLGYHVITAADGKSALAKLRNGEKLDILFTDIVMPGGISGLDLMEEARKLRPGLRVLLTSGYPLETLAARGKLTVSATILNKPYRKAELARRLREVMQASTDT